MVKLTMKNFRESEAVLASSRDVYNPAALVRGSYIRLPVSDNGTGIDAATLAHISEPFFTTKPQGKGAGLAMARGFTEQSDDGISIASTPGAGTDVTMWLRQATGIVPRVCELGHCGLKPTWPFVCVLIIDDNDQVREILAAQLEAGGFDTLVAASGEEGLALIAAGHRIDALVSDLSTPNMDGLATIRRARALCPALPCFLLTGDVSDGAALSSDNDFTVVRKPVTAQKLGAQILDAIEGIMV